jgi:hypothetical protein
MVGNLSDACFVDDHPHFPCGCGRRLHEVGVGGELAADWINVAGWGLRSAIDAHRLHPCDTLEGLFSVGPFDEAPPACRADAPQRATRHIGRWLRSATASTTLAPSPQPTPTSPSWAIALPTSSTMPTAPGALRSDSRPVGTDHRHTDPRRQRRPSRIRHVVALHELAEIVVIANGLHARCSPALATSHQPAPRPAVPEHVHA